MPPSQNQENDQRGNQLRKNRRNRRALDPHRRDRSEAHDEKRIEDHIQNHAAHHHEARDFGIARGNQKIVARHAERRGAAPEVPGCHIGANVGHDLRIRSEQRKGRFNAQNARNGKEEGDQEDQKKSGRDQFSGFCVVPTPERLRRIGHHTDSKSAEDAADQHDDRKGEAHCRQWNFPELADKVGVCNIVSGHRQSSRQHGKCSHQHGFSNGARRVSCF